VLARPRLHVRLDGHAPFIDRTAWVIYGNGGPHEAMYLRGRLTNFGMETARECSAFVDRISIGEKLYDSDRSPLPWTHENGDAAYLPRSVGRWRKRSVLFDICKVDRKYNELQILTKRSQRGYDTFVSDGIYEIEIAAEAANWASSGKMTVLLSYTKDPADLIVLGVTTRSRFPRLW
jgi:hypothetical protein